jgi:hypothetical protein
MLIAKIENGQVVDIADYQSMFPNTSFASSGPNAKFMADNNCMPVNTYLDYDSKTEFLESCEPYIMDGWVYTVKVSKT